MQVFPPLRAGSVIAAGVSGGPDSMALLRLLSEWALRHDIAVHAYTVDHGLRAESAAEAAQVSAWVGGWPGVTHHILRWEGEKPETRILEEARAARYALMAASMKEAGADSLFIAHHADDQAETVLIRLSRGSGLDGLAGMRKRHPMERLGITLLRPLLDIPKAELVRFCDENDIPYVSDPTNSNGDYLRPRLRAARPILEEEGLSAKRLGMTARRMARAKAALDDMGQDLFTHALKEQKDDGFMFDYRALHAAHEELALRVILAVMERLHPGDGYGPRLERLEKLLERILRDGEFKGATLGGCVFALDRRNESLWIGKE
ncbi:MAG: tRNA lysidine(34) synthetase TilS [Micavibrio sp.]